ncbi:PTS sugar transporter subunit IIA [Raoultella planticola]
MAHEISYICELSEGIHARPAGLIARVCDGYHAEIMWQNMRTGLVGSAKSALSLIATDTLQGDCCRIRLDGPDQRKASIALSTLLKQLPDFTMEQEPASGDLPCCLAHLQPDYLQGTRINAGIAIAPALHMQGISLTELLSHAPSETTNQKDELQRLNAGMSGLCQKKESALQATQGIEHDLIEAHLAFMTDREFINAIQSYIHQGMNAWSAVVNTSLDVSNLFSSSSSHYIQERALDILDITLQILQSLYDEYLYLHNKTELDQPTIVFASTLTPSQLLSLNRENIAGLVLSSTGSTSHTAILARALDIPTLADIDLSAVNLQPSQIFILDGEHGILINGGNEKLLRYYRDEIDIQQKVRQRTPEVLELSKNKPLIVPEMIQWKLDVTDKNEVIKKMVDNLWLHRRTDARDKLYQDIWARENPFPTVVGSGFAIPHARTSAVHVSTISVARLVNPVTWGGVQVDTVFMLSISESGAENDHMRYFSTLARILMNDEFVSKAKATTTPDELYNLIFSALSL